MVAICSSGTFWPSASIEAIFQVPLAFFCSFFTASSLASAAFAARVPAASSKATGKAYREKLFTGDLRTVDEVTLRFEYSGRSLHRKQIRPRGRQQAPQQ